MEQGEFVAIVGTSGSGKSTLLHMMGGLDTPTSGSVIVRGEELAKKNDDELTIFRRRNIGFIFQNYNLVPILNEMCIRDSVYSKDKCIDQNVHKIKNAHSIQFVELIE